MTELGGLLLLVAGFGALAATGSLVACCLRLRSPIEFVLAAYLVSWTWLVAVTLALSPARWVTRAGIGGGVGAGLLCALVVWLACGRPRAPRLGPALARARAALRHPAVLALAVAVAVGTTYVGALAFFTPANDWDALAYHLARASLWKQQHGLGYVDTADDSRLNVNPPNAEIGQLATMLLSESDRYAAVPQLLAYGMLALSVAGLARRAGLGPSEAVFAALAFATLPVVALQASGALNDLVVASFLTAAAFFALGVGSAPLVLTACAIALAVGTKFTGLLALPTLAFVLAVGRSPRRWPGLLLAGAAGLALGSTWYVVNLLETGHLDGGSAGEFDQRADVSPAGTTTTALRLALAFVDMSGAPWPTSLLFFVGACTLAAVGWMRARRSRAQGIALATAAVVTAGVVAYPVVWELGVRAVYKIGLVLGTSEALLDGIGWGLNTRAEPTFAGYGPLALLLLAAGSTAALVGWLRGRRPALVLALAAAPWVLLVTLALTLVWDPWRERFLLFGVALAAATWGVLLRSNALAMATAAIGSTALFLTLAGYHGKPSGLLAEPSIWGDPRWAVQTRLSGPRETLRFMEENVPENARIGISLPGNHHLHPYFGPRLSRHVSLVPRDGGEPPADIEWLVIGPQTSVRRCRDAWQPEFIDQDWHVERRIGPDACLTG